MVKKASELRVMAERLKKRFQNEVDFRFRGIRDYILPELGKFSGESRRHMEDRRAQYVIISTAQRSNQILASGLQSGMTNPSQKWFLWRPRNRKLLEFGGVRAWFDAVERLMYQTLAASNFYHVMHGAYTEFGPFGIFDVLMEEDDRDVVRFTHLPVGSYYWANNARQEIDTVVWEKTYTARQIKEKFGEDNMSKTSKDMLSQDPDGDIECYVIVMPRGEYNIESDLATDMPWAAYVVEKSGETEADDKILMESGYREFPHLVARWFSYANDVYSAQCPGISALPDVKMLQHSAKRIMQAADKAINPPMRVPRGYGQRLKLIPGSQNEVSSANADAVSPLLVINPAMMVPMQQWAEQTKQVIKEHFFEDLFLTFIADQRSGITATEIMEEKQEKMSVLGPVVGRFMKHVLDPLLVRLFHILNRRGMLPPVPQELQGSDIDVEYVSILAQAQRASERNAISAYVDAVVRMSAVKQDMLDKVDFDQVADELASILGIPAEIIRPDDQVQGIREERIKAMQMQAAMQSLQGAADVAQKAGNVRTDGTVMGAASQVMGLGAGGQ